MNSIKVPQLDGDLVVEKYPASVAAFKQWIGTFPNIEALGTDMDKQIAENSLKAVFYFSPRTLYEFFDAVGLELLIGKIDDHWYHTISNDLHSYSTESRITAEEMGFQLCFDTLEKQLTKNDNKL